MTSLLQFEILNSTAELEEVFDDVFFFAAVFTWVRLDHKLITVLAKHLAEGFSGIIYCLIIQKMQLLQDIDKVNLFLRCQILLDDWAVFLIKLLDLGCLSLFLFDRWQIHSPRAEESIAVGSAGDATLIAEEWQITEPSVGQSRRRSKHWHLSRSILIHPRPWRSRLSPLLFLKIFCFLHQLLSLVLVCLHFSHSLVVYLLKFSLIFLFDLILDVIPLLILLKRFIRWRQLTLSYWHLLLYWLVIPDADGL